MKLTLWLTGDWNGQGVDGEGTNGRKVRMTLRNMMI